MEEIHVQKSIAEDMALLQGTHTNLLCCHGLSQSAPLRHGMGCRSQSPARSPARCQRVHIPLNAKPQAAEPLANDFLALCTVILCDSQLMSAKALFSKIVNGSCSRAQAWIWCAPRYQPKLPTMCPWLHRGQSGERSRLSKDTDAIWPRGWD